MKILTNLMIGLMLSYFSIVNAETEECTRLNKMNSDQIKEYIIKSSIIHYQTLVGQCPCPFSYDSFYNQYCAGNSAYSRNNIKPVKCFPSDVNGVDIANLRAQVCPTSPPSISGTSHEDYSKSNDESQQETGSEQSNEQ